MKGTGPLQQSLAKLFVVPEAQPNCHAPSPRYRKLPTPRESIHDHQAYGPMSTVNSSWFPQLITRAALTGETHSAQRTQFNQLNMLSSTLA